MWPEDSEYAGECGQSTAGETGAAVGTEKDGCLQWTAKETEDSPDWTRSATLNGRFWPGIEGVEEIGVAGSKLVRRTKGMKRHKTAAQWNARRASRVALTVTTLYQPHFFHKRPQYQPHFFLHFHERQILYLYVAKVSSHTKTI